MAHLPLCHHQHSITCGLCVWHTSVLDRCQDALAVLTIWNSTENTAPATTASVPRLQSPTIKHPGRVSENQDVSDPNPCTKTGSHRPSWSPGGTNSYFAVHAYGACITQGPSRQAIGCGTGLVRPILLHWSDHGWQVALTIENHIWVTQLYSSNYQAQRL